MYEIFKFSFSIHPITRIPLDGTKAISRDRFEDCKVSSKMLAVPVPTTPILT